MADGMPKPKRSTIDTIKHRGRDLDEQIDAASTNEKKAAPKAEEPKKGLPKPSLLDRAKRMIGL